MCEPASITMGVMAVASAAMSVQQAQSQADYQSRLARRNAETSEQAAADALLRGQQEAGVERMKGTQLEAKQRVALASGSVETSGSAAGILADSRLASGLDAARLANNAAREAWGYRVQGAQAVAQGSAARAEAQWQTAGSILGGIGGVAGAVGHYYSKKKPGGPPPKLPSGGGGGDYGGTYRSPYSGHALTSPWSMDYSST